MKQIELSAGRGIVLVSDCDFEALSAFRWHLHSAGYAYRAQKKSGKQTNFLMHRQIMQPEKSMLVDHINGNRLDNRRENLRLATHAQNACNNAAIVGTSARRGVSWHTSRGKWRATIKVDGRARHVGYFATEDDAAAAYDKAATDLHGEFARLNEVQA
ncbi:MAG: HNH endonuclease [Sphingomonadales bacterium]|nr:HNH endonuclease [Sphingomonadales bacterium]